MLPEFHVKMIRGGGITIPKPIRKKFNLKEGDIFLLYDESKKSLNLTLKKAKVEAE